MNPEILKRIKYFRSKANLTQGELAKQIGVSTKQVSDYEVGRSIPRKKTFAKILEVFNLSESEFWNAKVIDVDDSDQDDFASRLVIFRKNLEMNQTSFALAVGLSQKQISDYEIGLSKPRQRTFNKILEVLGIDNESFWSLEIKPKSPKKRINDKKIDEFSENLAKKLAEKTGVNVDIAKAIIADELKGSIFVMSEKKRQKLSDDNLKRIEDMAKDGASINGDYTEI